MPTLTAMVTAMVTTITSTTITLYEEYKLYYEVSVFSFLFFYDIFRQMWEDLPFGKTGTGLLVFGGSTVMVGLILMACNHQQKKQGFAK